MLKSKEIRWFARDKNEAILSWFALQGLTFANTEPRTDHYLSLGKDDVTVKLREGNIEIKHRTGLPVKGSLTPSVEGYFENWEKWSFTASETDTLSKEIISGKYNWIKTIKTRLGVKLTRDAAGHLQILPIKTFVDYGCQMEYTQVELEGRTWFTFGLEWFGGQEVEVDPELLKQVLGNTALKSTDSEGYGSLLNK